MPGPLRKAAPRSEPIDFQRSAWDTVAGSVHFSLPVELAKLTSLIPFEARFLDYGCGYGRIARLLVRAGYTDVVGFDTSPGMIQRGKIENPDLDLQRIPSHVVPAPDDSFDAAVVSGVFTSLPEEETRLKVVSEIRRVLRPGGVLAVGEFQRDDRRVYDEEGCFATGIGVRMKHFFRAELERLFTGWDIESFRAAEVESLSGHDAAAFYLYVRAP